MVDNWGGGVAYIYIYVCTYIHIYISMYTCTCMYVSKTGIRISMPTAMMMRNPLSLGLPRCPAALGPIPRPTSSIQLLRLTTNLK